MYPHPVLVVGGGPISLLVLFDHPHSGVGEELEGGPDLFGSWDVVGVLHAYDDPLNILRRLHGPVGAFEGPNDCEEGLSGVDVSLDVFIKMICLIVLGALRALAYSCRNFSPKRVRLKLSIRVPVSVPLLASTPLGFVWNTTSAIAPMTRTMLQPHKGSSETLFPSFARRCTSCFNPTRVRLKCGAWNNYYALVEASTPQGFV